MDEEAVFPIIVIKSVTYIQPFYYFDEDNNPIDLTGCTAKMQARDTVDSIDDPIFDWNTEDGQITIDGPAGCVLVSVDATQTAALPETPDAVYSLLLTFPSGVVQQLVMGPISILGQITR